MNRSKIKSTIAIAALAGLTISAAASQSYADRVRGGGSFGPIEETEAAETPLVREIEAGSGINDDFANRTDLAAPNDEYFAVKGNLGEEDRACRDVDYIGLTGLAPLSDYKLTMFGSINDQMSTHWRSPFDGTPIFASADGVLNFVSDKDGYALIAASSFTDGDVDGDNDSDGLAHGLCGDYHFIVELVFRGDVNKDGAVDIGDVRAMLNMIGDTGESTADLNFDGIVDADDLRVLADLVQGKKAKKARKLAIKRAGKLEGMALKAAVAENAELLSATPNDPNAGDSGESSSGRRR